MTSHLIAQALSLYFFVMGIAMLVNSKRFASVFSEVASSSSLLLFSGVIALLFGIVIIVSHNVWLWEWQVFVTLAGWLAFLKGACLLIAPTNFISWFRPLFTAKYIQYIGYFLIMLGAIFGFFGFIG